MTFTEQEIIDGKISIDYDDGFEFDDDNKTITVKFYGFEDRLRKFFNLKDDYEDDWIDCWMTVNPIKEIATEIFMQFTSNCEIPDRELKIELTNHPEGKILFDELVKSDKDYGQFIQSIKQAKEMWGGIMNNVYDYVFIFTTEKDGKGIIRADSIIEATERVRDYSGEEVVSIKRATEIEDPNTGYINLKDMWV